MSVLSDTLCYSCFRTFFVSFWVTFLRATLIMFFKILFVNKFCVAFLIKLLFLLLTWLRYRSVYFLPFHNLILECRFTSSLFRFRICFIWWLLLLALSFDTLHSQEKLNTVRKMKCDAYALSVGRLVRLRTVFWISFWIFALTAFFTFARHLINYNEPTSLIGEQ